MRNLFFVFLIIITINSVNSDARAAACNTDGNPSLDEIGTMITGNWTIKYGSGSFIAPGMPLPFPIFADMENQTIQIKQNGNQLYGIPPGENGIQMDITWQRRSFYDLSIGYGFSNYGVSEYKAFIELIVQDATAAPPALAPGGCPISLDATYDQELRREGIKLVGEIGYKIPGFMVMDMWMIVSVIDTNNLDGVLWIRGYTMPSVPFEAWRSIQLVK